MVFKSHTMANVSVHQLFLYYYSQWLPSRHEPLCSREIRAINKHVTKSCKNFWLTQIGFLVSSKSYGYSKRFVKVSIKLFYYSLSENREQTLSFSIFFSLECSRTWTIYLPNLSNHGNYVTQDPFKADSSWFEFRVFLLQDRLPNQV